MGGRHHRKRGRVWVWLLIEQVARRPRAPLPCALQPKVRAKLTIHSYGLPVFHGSLPILRPRDCATSAGAGGDAAAGVTFPDSAPAAAPTRAAA